MLYRLVIIFLLGLVALPIKAETLKGRIVENEIRGRGLANVQIVDETVRPPIPPSQTTGAGSV
jgi:hypothetical protein